MDDQMTDEVLDDTEETDIEEEGSFMTTAVVFGVGAVVGAAATKSYGKVKNWASNKIEARRAAKDVEDDLDEIEADKKKK